MEKVAVIIPSYGGGELLERTVVSVLNQDYKNFEVIVVDDNGEGSENQLLTESIIKKFLNEPRFSYLTHKVNKNGSAARNTGVENSDAKYLVFLDDDDVMNQGTLQSQVDILNLLDESWGMVYCSSKEYYKDRLYAEYKAKVSGEILYTVLTHKIHAATSTWMVRRSAFESLNGFDESFKRHQDYEFIARMAYKYKIAANPHFGIKKYWSSLTISSNVQEVRDYYLLKMDSIIRTFSKRKQKNIILTNQLDISMKLLKERKFKEFFRRYRELNGGITGIFILGGFFSKIVMRKIHLQLLSNNSNS
ncbi:TPA: glycosyltransferase family 2 protein [Bacillus cereus]|uniref:glycosyltransferase family 2 protein n=1 Tax=Bacillus cereus group TaxID=86661 RepID=UPI000943A9DC|nr:glycosyltransferase family A protein [Bacillus pacificus]MCU5372184.1 glycosyltransferase [Bacillus pacificus]